MVFGPGVEYRERFDTEDDAWAWIYQFDGVVNPVWDSRPVPRELALRQVVELTRPEGQTERIRARFASGAPATCNAIHDDRLGDEHRCPGFANHPGTHCCPTCQGTWA